MVWWLVAVTQRVGVQIPAWTERLNKNNSLKDWNKLVTNEIQFLVFQIVKPTVDFKYKRRLFFVLLFLTELGGFYCMKLFYIL